MVTTVKCPQCGSGLKVTFRGEDYDGWKSCRGCGAASYVIVKGDGKAGTKSLHSMIVESKQKAMLAQALQFMLEKGKEAFVDDLYFNIGKKVEEDMEKMMKYKVIKRVGNHF
jgi:hypothetical protein